MAASPQRLVLIGWGAIGRTVGAMLDDGIDLVGVGGRRPLREDERVPDGAEYVTSPADLASLAPDVVAEAAGRDSVATWGRAALTCGADFIVSSTSALADAALLDELRSRAEANAAALHIQPGALGGIDALAAARAMGIDAVEHRIVKPPAAWRGTPADDLCDLDGIDEPTAFFTANAAQTASAFPKNANVAMITALAGVGTEATRITLVADPASTTNRHEISAHGAFGTLDVRIANHPLPGNPKTSAMAALSLARAIQNRASAILI